MKKLLFISTTLGKGGAERIISYLLNEFAKDQDKQVILLLLKKEGNTYLNNVSPNVKVINLDIKNRIRYSVFTIVRNIISIRPNICYIGLDKLNIMLAFFIPFMKLWKIRFIVRETNVLSQQYNFRNPLIKLSYKIFYNTYNSVIAQSIDMRDDLVNIWGIKKQKINLINNPINIEAVTTKSLSASNCKIPKKEGIINFVAVGRLEPQKGYDILLQRMAELGENLPFNVYILGEGSLLYEITRTIKQFKLEESVKLLGFQSNPYSILKQADGIILSSRHEGFPNVLLEANALGIPIFSNQCPGGINEIVIEGVNGVSCNFQSKTSFQNGLENFITTQFDAEKIKLMTKNRYDISVILPKYRNVFNQTEGK